NLYGSVTSTPAQLTVLAAPEILSGPTDQVATNGDTVVFTVTAQGGGTLGYQWVFNGTNTLPQGTSANLTLMGVTTANAGDYAVIVSDVYGSSTSGPAHLSVVVPASILVGPVSQQVTNGDTVVFMVTAQGTEPVNYKWYFNETNELAGAIGPMLMLNAVTPD